MTDQQIDHVLHQFDLDTDSGGCKSGALPGGTTQTFRVGNAVLKRIRETSLENDHSLDLFRWIADFSAHIAESGFRIPRPRATIDHAWMTDDGWTASTFLEGRHATADDIPACIQAILAFHRALKPIPKHPLMDGNQTAWGKAHRWCWGKKPDRIQPQLRPWVERLDALRRPVEGLEWQLIHGDLNPENILIAPGLPPAILDFSPFWGPVEFALAIFANFIGPRRGDAAVLKYFEGIPAFDQLLIRAGLRMLFVIAALDGLDGWETCSEKRAAEIIVDYACRDKTGSMKFREITHDDVPDLLTVRVATHENRLTREELASMGITEESVKERLNGSFKGWLCEVGDRVVGFAMGDRSTGELWVIAVLPEYIGQGIGSRLLIAVENWLKEMGCARLWLTTDIDMNLKAYSFYRRHGWSDDHIENDLRYMIKNIS